MARAQPAPLAAANTAKRAAAEAKKARDLSLRRALAVRDLYWTNDDFEQEQELLRAEIDRRIAAGEVTICPPFGLKGDRADLKAASDVAHVMQNWVITDESDAAA